MTTKNLKVTLQGTLIVVHGPPGIGKTQLASKFPGPHQWYATEPGQKFIPEEQQSTLVKLIPEDDAWDLFKRSVRQAPKARCIVVDEIGGLYELCMESVCKKNGWAHPSDGAHGKGWAAVKREFVSGLGKLAWKADKHKSTLIFLCHSKVVTIETATTSTEKISLALPGQAHSIVTSIPDHIWFMSYSEMDPTLNSDSCERALFMDGTPGIEAKCRDDRVTKKRIKPLSKDKPYQQILAALNRRTK